MSSLVSPAVGMGEDGSGHATPSQSKDSAGRDEAQVDAQSSPKPNQEPMEVTSKEDGANDGGQPASGVTEDQWKAMFEVMMAAYEYRLSE
jgi:hypothetical protein